MLLYYWLVCLEIYYLTRSNWYEFGCKYMLCKSVVGTLPCQIFRPCSVQEVNRNKLFVFALTMQS